MKFNHWAMAVAACAALIATGFTTGAADAQTETECSNPVLTSTAVQLASPGRWAYRYHVTWCVEKGEITAITPHITHEQDGTTCVWVTNAEEAYTRVPDDSGAWVAFNMGEFRCKKGDGTDGSVNPWGKITVWPDGSSSVLSKGVGDVVVP